MLLLPTSTARVRKQETNFCLSPRSKTCWVVDWWDLNLKKAKLLSLTWLMIGSCSFTRSWMGWGAMFSPPAVMIKSYEDLKNCVCSKFEFSMLLSHLLSANDGMEVLIVDRYKVTRSERNGILQWTVIFWCCLCVMLTSASHLPSCLSWWHPACWHNPSWCVFPTSTILSLL